MDEFLSEDICSRSRPSRAVNRSCADVPQGLADESCNADIGQTDHSKRMTIQELMEFEQMLKENRLSSGAENFTGPAPTEAQKLYLEQVSEKLRAGETVDLSEGGE